MTHAQPARAAFAALRYRDFRLFWSAHVVSNVGSWMQLTATSWLLYELTGSAFQLGLNGVSRAVPTIFLGLLGGALVDKHERKRLLLLAQIGLMCLAFLLAILDQTGSIQLWHVYAITFTGIVKLSGTVSQVETLL